MIFTENKKNVTFTVALFLGLFLPRSNFIGQVVNGLLPVFLFLLLVDKKNFKVNKYAAFFVLIVFLSFILNAFMTDDIETKSLLRGLSLTLVFLLFPFCENVKISNTAIYISVLLILLSQLAFTFGITPIVNIIDKFYPYDDSVRGFSSDFLLSEAGDIDFILNRRYGGIYRNPNQAVRYVSALFIVFLIENKQKAFTKLLPFIVFVVISILLSGSRTGIIVIVLLLFGQHFVLRKQKNKTTTILSFLFLLGTLLIIYMQLSTVDLRVFDIGKGFDNSLGTKLDWFFDFFNQLHSIPRTLVGHFSTDNIQQYGLQQLDSEWGELFYNFGLLGFIALTLFYISIYKTKNKNLRFYLLILLWGITSTVIFSFRMSFVFMLLLSKYYSEIKLNKDDEIEYKKF